MNTEKPASSKKKKKTIEISSLADCEDVLHNILSRLPAKSFASAACVNKSWNCVCNSILSRPRIASACSFKASAPVSLNSNYWLLNAFLAESLIFFFFLMLYSLICRLLYKRFSIRFSWSPYDRILPSQMLAEALTWEGLSILYITSHCILFFCFSFRFSLHFIVLLLTPPPPFLNNVWENAVSKTFGSTNSDYFIRCSWSNGKRCSYWWV